MSNSSRRTGLRLASSSALALSTALVVGGFAIVAPTSVYAQSLPVLAGTPGANGGAGVSDNGTTTTVTIGNQNRVIDWDSYNVGVGKSVVYTSTTDNSLSVLNRVDVNGTVGLKSTIQGLIDATNVNPDTSVARNNISIWLVNANGIVMSAGGAFSGGSLVLSTLPAASFNLDMTNGANGSVHFVGTPAAGSELTLSGGGAINASGSVLLAGENITVSKPITASGQVAIVAARDLTFAVSAGSPLAITVAQGTTLGTIVTSNVSGSSVKVVGASHTSVINDLLDVSAATLTASTSGGAVVLATTSDTAHDITVDPGARGTDDNILAGPIGLGTTADFTAAATGAVTAGAITARNISITGKTVPIGTAGKLTAAEDLTLDQTAGDLVFNPNDGTAHSWKNLSLTVAAGNVDVSDAGGFTRTTAGSVTLVSTGGNVISNAAGLTNLSINGDVTVSAAQGVVQFSNISGANVSVTGKTLTLSPIVVNPIQATGNLTIDYRGATALAFAPTNTLGLRAWGTSGTGNLTLTGAHGVILTKVIDTGTDATNLSATTGNISATAAAGDVSALGITTTDGGISLVATAGAVTVGANPLDANGAAGDIVLTGPTGIDATKLTADGSITLNSAVSATSVDYAAGTFIKGDSITSTAAGGIKLTAGTSIGGVTTLPTPVNMALSASGGAAGANNVAVNAGGTVSLGNVTATDSSIGIKTGGNLKGAAFTAGEDIAIRVGGAGSITNITGEIKADDDINIDGSAGTGAITLGKVTSTGTGPFGKTIDLGAGNTDIDFASIAPPDVGANIYIKSAAALTISDQATNTNLADGGNIVLEATTIDAKTLTAKGDIDIKGPVAVNNPTLEYTAGGKIAADSITNTNGHIMLTAGTTIGGHTVGTNMTLNASSSSGGYSNVIVDAGGSASLADVTAGTLGIIRAGGPTVAGTVDAQNDIGVLVSNGTFNATALKSGDDIGVKADGAITIGDVIARGDGQLDTTISLSPRPTGITASGPDAVGSNINLQSTLASVTITGSAKADTGTAGDILIDAATDVTANGTVTLAAKNTIAIRAQGTGTAKLGTLTAGEDVSIQAGGDAIVTKATAGDDLTVTASGAVRIGEGVIAATGNGLDARKVDYSGPTIGFSVDTQIGRNLVLTTSNGDITGLSTGPSTFGRAKLTVNPENGKISVNNINNNATAQLGELTAGTGTGLSTTDQIRVLAGAIDVLKVDSKDGKATLKASMAAGDLAVAGSVTARGDISLTSAAGNVRIADYVAATPGPEAGFVRSTGGDVTINAANSVTGLPGSDGLITATGYGAIKATGTLEVLGSDVRVDSLEAGGDIDIKNTGSLTGTKGTGPGTNITGGSVFSNAGAISIVAGTTATDSVRLHEVKAATTTSITGGNIAIGTLTSQDATFDPTKTYIGLLQDTNNLSVTFVGGPANLNVPSISTSDDLETGAVGNNFGKVAIKSTNGAITAGAVGAIDNAELGNVDAKNAVAITANGITSNGLIQSSAGSISLTANQGTLEVNNVNAKTTATLTKTNGALANAGDEVRIKGKLTTGTDATVRSNTNARIAEVEATAGNVLVELTGATPGDVTGLAGAGTATDTLPGFGRAKLTAVADNKTITVTATNATGVNGVAQLGDIKAGASLTLPTITTDQVIVNARVVDIGTAKAINGNLALTASEGELRLDTGTAGNDATVKGKTNVRVNSVTTDAGKIVVTAETGDLSGLARTSVNDGSMLAGFGRANLNAKTNGQTVTASADSLTSIAQFGTVLAGDTAAASPPTVATVQIQLTAKGGVDATDVKAANGGLTANALGTDGSVQIASGKAGTNIVIGATQNVRTNDLTARTGDITITAASRNVTGLVTDPTQPVIISLVPTLATNSGASNLNAGGSITVNATNGIAQLNTVTAGQDVTVNSRAMSIVTGTATNGELKLTATDGSLVLDTGSAGTNAVLKKTLDAAATDDVVSVGTLTAGTRRTFAGAVTIESFTDIRADSVTAHGGDVTLKTTDTTTAGTISARNTAAGAKLTADEKLMADGSADLGTGLAVKVTSGGLARLADVTAGTGVTINAGAVANANWDGGIIADHVVAGTGDASLVTYNDRSPTANGVTATSVVAGGFAALEAGGSNGGTIKADLVKAGTDVVLNAAPGNVIGNVLVDTAQAGDSIAARANNLITGTDYTAGEDISATAGGALSLRDAKAGDDIVLKGATVSLRSGQAIGDGPDGSEVDFAQPTFFGPPTQTNANLAITSTVGNVVVTGDLSAQRNVTINAATDATLQGNATAGAPIVAGGPVITGALTINAGTTGTGTLSLGGSSVKATGAVALKATKGDVRQTGAALTIQSNSDGTVTNTEGLSIKSETSGNVALGASTLIGGLNTSLATGRQSVVQVTTDAGTATLGTVGANGLTVRATGQVTVNGTIDAGNAARAIDPAVGPATVDIVTTVGGIGLTGAVKAEGDNHDIVLSAPGLVSTPDLTATRNVAIRGGTVSTSAIMATAGSIAVRSDNGITGTTFIAGRDIWATAGQDLKLDEAKAGDDIDLTGKNVTLIKATALGTTGAGGSAVDFSTFPNVFGGAETAAQANANLTIRATDGAVKVTGDLSAQRNVTISATSAAQADAANGTVSLAGNVTAGAPVAPATSVIAGDLTIDSTGALTLGGAAATTMKATGAVKATSGGNVTQGAGALTIQSNSDQSGTETLAIAATSPATIALGNTTFVGGSTAGHESVVDLRATGGTVTFGKVDGQGLIVRAGGQVTATDAIATGNTTRAADPIATFNTVDIATTAGGIALTTATATGTGHDVLLSAPGAVTATALTGARNVGVTSGSANIGTATATSGTLSITGATGDVVVGTGKAGTTATLATTTSTTGNVIVNTLLDGGTSATVTSVNDARLASVTAGAGGITVNAAHDVIGATTGTSTSLVASGPLGVTAGGLAALGGSGSSVTVNAGTISAGEVTATTGALAMTSTGDLTLAKGKANTDATLKTTGTGNVTVTTSLDAGTGATVTSVKDARLASVTAGTGGITVNAAQNVIGATTGSSASLVASGPLGVTAGGLAALGGSGSSVTVNAGTISAGEVTATTGALAMTATGDLTLAKGKAGTTAALKTTGTGNVTVSTSLDAVTGATVTSVSDARLASVTAGTGGITVNAAQNVIGATTGSSASLVGSGPLGVTAGGLAALGGSGSSVTVNAGTISAGEVTATTGALAMTATGDLTLAKGKAGTTAALKTTGTGNVTVSTSLDSGQAATITSVKDAYLASVTAAAGEVRVTATSGQVTGIGAGNANLVASTGAVTVEGGTLARLGTVGAAGTTGITVTADTISADNANAGNGALSLVADGTTGTGNVTLGTGNSKTTSTIDAKGLATISTGLTAGSSAKISAANAEIGGNVTAVTRIDVVDTGTGALVLGSATGTGFALSATEVNRLNAPEIGLDAKSNAVAIGALAFDADSGANRVDVMGLGRIDITGTVSAPGGSANRVVRFGGSATAADKATVIRVAANADGTGGRLLMPNAALELRGVKIGVGQDTAFLAALGLTPTGTPISAAQAGSDFVSNPQSTLYYAGNFGGAPYNPVGQDLVTASSLTVKVGDYALFQNTGTVGQTKGATIDSRTTNPRVPALTVSGPNPPDAGAFAIFGTFNGFEASAAALLPATDVSVIAVNGAFTRINGCIVGSGGGGCLSNSIVQPTVNVFDSSRSDVLKTSSDFEAPFDPVVGTNNESLFGDVGTFGLEDIPLSPDSSQDQDCGGPNQAPCATSEGEKK